MVLMKLLLLFQLLLLLAAAAATRNSNIFETSATTRHAVVAFCLPPRRFGRQLLEEQKKQTRKTIFSTTSSTRQRYIQCCYLSKRPVVVVGTAIIDNNSDNNNNKNNDNDANNAVNSPPIIATWGATMALAALDSIIMNNNHQQQQLQRQQTNMLQQEQPFAQPVTLLLEASSSFSPSLDTLFFPQQLQQTSLFSSSTYFSFPNALCQPPIIVPHQQQSSFTTQHYQQALFQSIANNNNDYDFYNNINNNMNNYNQKPILHLVLQSGLPAVPLLDPTIQSEISFLGLHPHLLSQQDFSSSLPLLNMDLAQGCATLIDQIINARKQCVVHKKESAAISLNLPLHLCWLRRNCIPKSKFVHGDSFHVFMPNAMDEKQKIISKNDNDNAGADNTNNNDIGGSVLVDYLFNYNNRLGGTDPLSCPTKEYIIVPRDNNNKKFFNDQKKETTNNASNVLRLTDDANFAAAAAYTALRGNGMDKVTAACIASSVGDILLLLSTNHDYLPPFTIQNINHIIRYSQALQQRVTTTSERILLQKYKQFGFR